MRGLKPDGALACFRTHPVAPYVGAWIETVKPWRHYHQRWVAPYVGAWIETGKLTFNYKSETVAPYVGAWIETWYQVHAARNGEVAPYVGAWIETTFVECYHPTTRSHPTWVRGLKPFF